VEQTGNRCFFNHAKRLIALFSALLFLSGCEKREIYSQIMVEEAATFPECVSVQSDGLAINTANSAFSEEGILVTSRCPAHVSVTKSRALCSLEKQKSAASAGVIRMELFNGETVVYRVQKEFWDESDGEILSALISRMREELPARRQ